MFFWGEKSGENVIRGGVGPLLVVLSRVLNLESKARAGAPSPFDHLGIKSASRFRSDVTASKALCLFDTLLIHFSGVTAAFPACLPFLFHFRASYTLLGCFFLHLNDSELNSNLLNARFNPEQRLFNELEQVLVREGVQGCQMCITETDTLCKNTQFTLTSYPNTHTPRAAQTGRTCVPDAVMCFLITLNTWTILTWPKIHQICV